MLAFAVLLTAYLLSQFFRAFLAIVSVELSTELHLDAAQLGQISAIWFAVFALAQFPVGVALDRFGPRRTISLRCCSASLGAGCSPPPSLHGVPRGDGADRRGLRAGADGRDVSFRRTEPPGASPCWPPC